MIDIAYSVTVPATVKAPAQRIGDAVVDLLSWLAAIAAEFAARIAEPLVVLGDALGALTQALLPPQARSPFLNLHGSLPAFIVLFSCTLLPVGLGEELQCRGFVMSRLARVCGGGRAAWVWAVAVSSVVFGLAHASHGPGTVVFVMGMGVMFGVTYLRTGRNLWVRGHRALGLRRRPGAPGGPAVMAATCRERIA